MSPIACPKRTDRRSRLRMFAVLVSFLWLLPACERGQEITEEQLRQHEPSEPAMAAFGPVIRTDVASITIPSEREKPHVLKLMRETLEPGLSMSYAGAERVVVQVAGTQAVTIEGRTTVLKPDEGLHVEAGLPAKFTAQEGETSVALHYLLVPEPQADRSIDVQAGQMTELYRTEPVIKLAEKPHVLTLSHLTIPALTPETQPQVPAGPALYHVVSGTGQLTSEDKTDAIPAGSTVYEPPGMVHQWSNSGAQPLTLVVANVAPEGSSGLQFDRAQAQGAPPHDQHEFAQR